MNIISILKKDYYFNSSLGAVGLIFSIFCFNKDFSQPNTLIWSMVKNRGKKQDTYLMKPTKISNLFPTSDLSSFSIFSFAFTISLYLKVSSFRNVFLVSSVSFVHILEENSKSVARANLNYSKKVLTSTTTAPKYIPKRPRICIN